MRRCGRATSARSFRRCQLRGRRRGAPARGRGDAVLRRRGQQLSRRRLGARRRIARSARSSFRSSERPTIWRTDAERRARSARARSSPRCRCIALRRAAAWAARRQRADAASACARHAERWPTKAPALVRALEAARGRRSRSPRMCRRGRSGARPPRGGAAGATSTSCCAPTTRASCITSRSRGRGVFLRASPIDVSTIVRELLLDRMNATVLTSATLTRRRLVRLRARPARHPARARVPAAVGVRLRAPGDPLSAEADARSAVAASSRAAAAREVIEILKRTRGRAFVLFTSYANLREVQAIARDGARLSDPGAGHGAALGAAARVQGDAERRAARDVELLAGRGCRRRGVELRDHRQAAVRVAGRSDHGRAHRSHQRRGGSAFGEYQIPLAILALQQGLGRLLRHRQDRGVLAVLDPRLRTMGYGRRFSNSLPPAPVTSELRDIDRFFGYS